MQANGLDERFNQTLQRMLGKFVQNDKDNWDTLLDTCVFAYNTSCHESTRYTPFEVMFGRKATLPIDIDVEKPEVLQSDSVIPTESVDVLTNIRITLLKEVKNNISQAQQKQKEAYDRKHANPSTFEVGATVLKRDLTRKKRRGGKLDPKWLGPYTIDKDLGKGCYQLSAIGNPKDIVSRVNGGHLKLYHKDPSRTSSPLTSSSLFNSSPGEPILITKKVESCCMYLTM